MRSLLALSVALNLLLLTTIVAARIDPERVTPPGDDTSATAATYASASWGAENTAGIDRVLSALESAALDRAQIRLILLGWLQASYRAAFEPQAPGYWQAGFSPARDLLAARLAVEDAVRSALIRIYGADAARDPVFDPAFRPLGAAYDFLGSDAQLALQRRQYELLQEAPAGANGAPVCRIQRAAGAQPESEVMTGLSEEEQAEYRLRFSPLAAQLRQAEVAANETEFRELFRLARALETQSAPAAQAGARKRLRSRIGDAAFDRFWALRDPFFGPLEQYLTRQGIRQHQVWQAYSIINRSQEMLLETIRLAGDEAMLMAEARRVREQQLSGLTALFGDQVAQGIVAAIARVAIDLGRGEADAC